MTVTDDRESPGAAALDAVAAFIGKYVVFPDEHCLPAVTLWAAHTWAIESFYVTPRLILDSAEPGSGKTRALEVLNLLVRKPELMLSPSTAAIFRMLFDEPITLLFDETDAIFNPKAAGNTEDLRALLNAGYKRGATIPRCVGDAARMKVQRFQVFAPVVLAGIAGHMPSTITTRAVTIHMRRRAPGEHVASYRERDAEAEAKPVRATLAQWVAGTAAELADARPDMPDGVRDRDSEVWEALLAVADAAGGDWPKRAREACRHFVVGNNPGALSLGVRLLMDLKEVFGNRTGMATVEILEHLTAMDEAPWADMWGKPLDGRRLARELARYEIAPVPFKLDGKTVKGYTTFAVEQKGARSVGLLDAWKRYLPRDDGNEGNGGNSAGHSVSGEVTVTDTPVTEDHRVTDPSVTVTDPKPPLTSEVTPVTAVTDSPKCRACGEPMTVTVPGQTTHPGCTEGNAA